MEGNGGYRTACLQLPVTGRETALQAFFPALCGAATLIMRHAKADRTETLRPYSSIFLKLAWRNSPAVVTPR